MVNICLNLLLDVHAKSSVDPEFGSLAKLVRPDVGGSDSSLIRYCLRIQPGKSCAMLQALLDELLAKPFTGLKMVVCASRKRPEGRTCLRNVQKPG